MLNSWNNILLTLMFILVFAGLSPIICQDNTSLGYERISTYKGLSSNTINQTIKDELGYIYFATTSGLDRFDGTNIKHFKKNGSSSSLSHNHTTCLLLDKKQRLWVGTEDGLNVKTDDDTFISYHPIPGDQTSLVDPSVESLFEDSQGRVWIGTHNGLSMYDEAKNTFVNFVTDPNNENTIAQNSVKTIFEDKNNFLWISTWSGGLSVLDIRSEIIDADQVKIRRLNYGTIHHKANGCFTNIFEDNLDRIWVQQYNGFLFRIGLPESKTVLDCAIEDIKFQLIPFNRADTENSNSYIHSAYYDEQKGLYLNTDAGYKFVSDEYISAKNVNSISAYIQSVNETEVNFPGGTHIYQDDNNVQWISSSNGVYKFFGNLDFDFDRVHEKFFGYRKSSILTFLETENSKTWIGAEDGFYKYNIEDESLTQIGYEAHGKAELKNIWAIDSDAQGQLWLGTVAGNLFKVSNLSSSKPLVELYPTAGLEELPNNNHIWKVENVDENFLLLGTHTGLSLYNKKQKEITTTILGGNNVFDIVMYEPHKYFASITGNGIIELEVDNGEIKYNFLESLNDNKLEDNVMFDLEYDDNKLWIATMSGLEYYDLKSQEFKKPEQIMEHIVEQVKAISSDSDKIYASTSNGIYSIQKGSNKIAHFNELNGICPNLSLLAAYKGPSGRIYFGGSQGFNVVNKLNAQSALHHEIVLTDLKISNNSVVCNQKDNITDEPILTKSIQETSTLSLSHLHKFITLDFTIFDYIDPYQYKFSYIIEGLDDSWKNLGSNKSISLTNLSPGSYNLIVKATNKYGEDLEPKSLGIQVNAPFWKQVWFPIAAMFGLVLMTLFGSNYYQKSVRRKNEELELAIQKRTSELSEKNIKLQKYIESNVKLEQFAHAASHDLKAPLRTISSYTGLLKKKLNGKLTDSENDYINFIEKGTKRLSFLITDLLDFSKINSEKLNFSNENPQTIIDNVLHSLEANISDTNANVTVDRLPKCICVDELKFSRVLQNLIANAIKFVKPGTTPRIHINFEKNLTHWIIRIKDNGVGISEENLTKIFEIFKRVEHSDNYDGTGMGLSISKKIIEAHGGELRAESILNEGSTFIIELPVIPHNSSLTSSPIEKSAGH